MKSKITKGAIRTMKKSDAICFRTEKSISTVECSKRDDYDNTYKFEAQTRFKSIHGMRVPKNYKCFCMISLYDGEFCPMKTVISLLKEDDIFRFVWYEGAGNTDQMEKVNFVSDHLYLEIVRKEKVKYNFLIHVSTGQNNTARMIKEV